MASFEDFIQASSFDSDHKLHSDVKSDHAAIMTIVKDNIGKSLCVIEAFNISNPTYHHYFGEGPFKQTHMFVDKDHIPNNEWLQNKIKSQMETIVDRMKRRISDVQIIVEGYDKFFNDIEESLGNGFDVVRVKHEVYVGSTFNITGIVVNRDKFNVLHNGNIQLICQDDNLSGKQKPFILPVVTVQHKETNHEFTIVGTHIPGCASQFPKNALMVFDSFINDPRYPNIIAMGDFNTTPKNIKSILTKSSVLAPLYPTHINPFCQIASYDNTVFRLNEMTIGYFDKKHLSNDSEMFVDSLLQFVK